MNSAIEQLLAQVLTRLKRPARVEAKHRSRDRATAASKSRFPEAPWGMLALLLCASPAASQRVDQNLWGTDGTVTAIARSGNMIYVGGSFTMVGPNTGGGVPVNRATGAVIAPYPQVAGVVKTVIPDGFGGWYIGGSFVGVGGLPRSNLARILPGGAVSSWDPSADGEILALALRGGTLYVAGTFSHVGGQARSYIAAVNILTGAATDWNPGPDAQVRALLLNRGRLYVGGDFATIGGQARNSVAELDVTTGSANDWNPNVGFSGGPGSVRALAASGDTIYVGGAFGSVGLQYRLNVAAIDAQTALATDWNPWATGPDDRYYGSPYVIALAVSKNFVYVGGHFTGIGGQVRGGLAEVDPVTGLATAWDPIDTVGPDITALAIRDSTLYLSGGFTTIGGQERNFAAEVSLKTGIATNWNPNVNSLVMTLAVSGAAVYVGGLFTGLGSQWQRRRCLAALDATTGVLKDWNPNPDGLGVETLLLTHGKVYVGGYFTAIGGQVRYGLAALDTLTGAATEWNPTANNLVSTLKVVEDTLYAGGYFTTIGGQVRNRLASFDLTSGSLTSWDPSANSDVYDLAVSGNTVYVVGFFSTMGGIPRRYGIAAVDATTGALLDWNPQSDNWVNAIAVVESTVFVGGRFNSIGGQSRINLAALDATTGQATPWVANANSEVRALAVMGDTLFAGGSFFSVGGQSRTGLAAVGVHTGAVLPWDPALSSIEWGSSVPHPIVWSLCAADGALYAGGLFDTIGNLPAASLTAVSFGSAPPNPSPIPRSLAMAPPMPNPVRAGATIRFALPVAGPVKLSVFDLQGRLVASLLNHVVQTAGWHEVVMHAEGWSEGFYFCRLDAGGASATQKMVVLR